MEAPTQPSVMLVYTTPVTSLPSHVMRSFFAFDEGGEVIETVETDADGQPDWTSGGICDARGSGGSEGFKSLHDALTSAETNARLAGVEITRIPA